MPAFAVMRDDDVEQIIAYMLGEAIPIRGRRRLSLGLVGEDQYGWHNFMELFSVFTSQPLFRVCTAKNRIGRRCTDRRSR